MRTNRVRRVQLHSYIAKGYKIIKAKGELPDSDEPDTHVKPVALLHALNYLRES